MKILTTLFVFLIKLGFFVQSDIQIKSVVLAIAVGWAQEGVLERALKGKEGTEASPRLH